jgi:hypothetical protein
MRLGNCAHHLRLVFGWLCVAAVFSSAAANRPPRTNSALGEPRVAYGAFLGLIRLGFENGIEPVCYASDEQGRAAIECYRRLTAAVGHLHDAEYLYFGDSQGVEPGLSLPCVARPQTTVLIGDGAVLTAPGSADIPMIQIDGGWRIDMTALVRSGALTLDDEARLSAETARIDAVTRRILCGD